MVWSVKPRVVGPWLALVLLVLAGLSHTRTLTRSVLEAVSNSNNSRRTVSSFSGSAQTRNTTGIGNISTSTGVASVTTSSHSHGVSTAGNQDNAPSSSSGTTGTNHADDNSNKVKTFHFCDELTSSTRVFRQTLQDDLEGTSLRALIVADDKDETKQWTFPPLSTQLLQSAFGGRSIVLVGDSTLFYTAQWMHRLMDSSSNNNAIPNHLLESLPHRNLSNAFDAITDYFTHSNHTRYDTTSFSTQLPTATNTTGHILWKGFRGTNQRKNCLFDQYVWPSILNPQLSPGNTNNTIRTPDILIANWGLHMFYRAILKPCNVDMWFHYEDWLHKVVQVAQQTGTVQLLLFKTTNLICHNLTQQQQSTKQAKCREKLQHFQNEMTTLTESDIQRYCENGLMLDRSARALNSRLERFVRALQPPPGLTVAIYNDYDLEDCRYTADNDGIHFHPLQLPRIRYMAHLIQCLYDPNNNNNNTSSTAAMTRT